MSDGKFHRKIGFAVGGIASWCLATGQPFGSRVLETLGGALAGVAGAKAPDWIDPPISPHHRSLGHGLVPIGSLAFWSMRNLKRWQAWLRTQTAALQAELVIETCGLRRLLLQIGIIACIIAAGAIAGLIAGYLSHIAFDTFTPASIPLFA